VTLDFQLEEERQNLTALLDNQSPKFVELGKTANVQVSLVVFEQAYSSATLVVLLFLAKNRLEQHQKRERCLEEVVVGNWWAMVAMG